MTKDQVFSNLTDIMRDVFDNDDLVATPELTAHSVNEWDSLNHIRLIVTVEKAFGVKFTTSEVSGFRDVGHLADTILLKSHHQA